MDGYLMLEVCDHCNGIIDEEMPDCGTCTCCDDDCDFYEPADE